MDVFEAIRTKRDVRRYQDAPIPDEAVRTILNAGRLSRSAKNCNLGTWLPFKIRPG